MPVQAISVTTSMNRPIGQQCLAKAIIVYISLWWFNTNPHSNETVHTSLWTGDVNLMPVIFMVIHIPFSVSCQTRQTATICNSSSGAVHGTFARQWNERSIVLTFTQSGVYRLIICDVVLFSTPTAVEHLSP